MSAAKLSVCLFGGFSATYGDVVLSFGKQTNAKFRQLFQILMTRPGEDFSKQTIAQNIYESGEVEDPNASLNNTIFRLRKYLEESPLPAGIYLTVGDGVIRFDGPVKVKSDAWELEKLSKEFKKETDDGRKRELCVRACELYQGEFLPQLSNEPWVIQKNHYYQKRYFAMLYYLLECLKKEGDYAEIERLSCNAMKLSGSSEWLIWQIESLNLQGRYQDALQVYQNAEEGLQERRQSPSKEQVEHLRKAGRRLQKPEGGIEGIYQYLQEEVLPRGAYCHTLPGFIDTYRLLKRLESRTSMSHLLILCTIQSADGRFLDQKKSSGKLEGKLQTVFEQQLRMGDIYTRYGSNQYLLLCVGAEERNLSEIIMRIDTDFQKSCHGRYVIRYRVMDSKG